MNSAQPRELALAYGLTAGAMLIGLLLRRADSRTYFRWPVYSAMVMALGVVAWNLLSKRLLATQWAALHPGALYYCALAVYVALGLACGMLLGGLTRKPPDSDSQS